MKLNNQPLVVKVNDGQKWLSDGYSLFKKQPLVWILSLATYWTAMFLFGLIPFFGLVATLILSPGLAFGFIALAESIDKGEKPVPKLIVSGFFSQRKKHLIFLGFIYLIALFLILLISMTFDDRSILDFFQQNQLDEKSKPIQTGVSRMGPLIALLTYIPVVMAFWFAPQLVVWGNFTALKALFYSFFAVWLNWRSFLIYLFFWFLIILVLTFLISLLGSIFSSNQQILLVTLLPSIIFLMAIAHGSYYSSTKSIFKTLENSSAD